MALFHLSGSLLVAVMAAVLVFVVWYPQPYGLLSGGRNLFVILVSVDVVCGPLLTLVLYSPKKPQREIFSDMALVVLIQLAALVYGMHTAYQARPLFLVHEVDRFRVVALPDFNGDDVAASLNSLKRELKPSWRSGPVTVGVRDPRDGDERKMVMLEAIAGGRDYAQRPEFYIPYDADYRDKALARAKLLSAFIDKYPETSAEAADLLRRGNVPLEQAKFLPVLHKQEWVAVMDAQARILGFLPGDGFSVP